MRTAASSFTPRTILPPPVRDDSGVRFWVAIERDLHECLVTHDALDRLASDLGLPGDALGSFQAFEAKIRAVARSRLLRGLARSPLTLTADCFH